MATASSERNAESLPLSTNDDDDDDDDEIFKFERMVQDMRHKSNVKKRKITDSLVCDYLRTCESLKESMQSHFQSLAAQLRIRQEQSSERMQQLMSEKAKVAKEVEGLVGELQKYLDDAEAVHQSIRNSLCVTESPVPDISGA